ncbi:hypothetical protein QFZ23_001205 [Arthrobacter globiformis]|uniref:DUF3592 domain-containing protein n=1 Tax=Arthrobacter globiformis TaxID=1665 RepID=UPI00277F3977|nr:DUF3592 domain-containing protein [Arthrobacter globiformis]MDQ1057304.1 hypothetical protein [Arthrobacter globiformis]
MKIVLYVIWALFVAGAVYSVLHVVRKAGRHEQLTAGWPRVQAAVTGSRDGWSGGAGNMRRNRRFWPTYQFTDSHGTLFMGESELSFAEQPVPGSPLEVAYNPANPDESFHVSSKTRITLGCLIPFFAVFAVALFWFIGVFPLG